MGVGQQSLKAGGSPAQLDPAMRHRTVADDETQQQRSETLIVVVHDNKGMLQDNHDYWQFFPINCPKRPRKQSNGTSL